MGLYEVPLSGFVLILAINTSHITLFLIRYQFDLGCYVFVMCGLQHLLRKVGTRMLGTDKHVQMSEMFTSHL